MAGKEISKKRHVEEDVAKSSRKRPKAPNPNPNAANPPSEVARRVGRVPAPEPVINTAPTTRLDVYVFGDGSNGELGLGPIDAVDITTPRLNPNLDARTVGVVDIAAGGMHAVALTHDNQILTWGVNDHSALGRNTYWEGGMRDVNSDASESDHSESDESDLELNPHESTPAAIPADRFPADTTFVQVAASDNASFALTDRGLVYGWGTFRNRNGVLGFSLRPNNTVIHVQRMPLLIPKLKNIVKLSAGNDFCIALDADGIMFAWGNGEESQLGRRLIARRSIAGLTPTRLALPRKLRVISIHAGANHAFAIDTNGDTWAWGSNNYAQTGIIQGAGEDGASVINPQKVPSLVGKNMTIIGGGSHHSVGITYVGQCLVWGRLDGAQLGLDLTILPLGDPGNAIFVRGEPRVLLEPACVPVGGNIHVAAGSDHTILITRDREAYSWGFNVNSQCGQGHNDDIELATLIEDPVITRKHLCWAGAGGQYSMIAAAHRDT